MAIRDILLQLASYPRPTPPWALTAASAFAEQFDARLSYALCQVHIPKVSNWLADKLVQANEAIAAENAKSRSSTEDLIAQCAALVPAHRWSEQYLVDCASMISPNEVAVRARSFDLTIVPAGAEVDFRVMAEGIVFESGRPVLLLARPDGDARPIESVAIGWDGSRASARALADALPICSQAKRVRLLQVTGDKMLGAIGTLSDVRRHLAAHGIDAEVEEISAEGRNAGAALLAHSVDAGADLLVMGAFGHSRAREFVLGSATRSILDDLRGSVFLSH